MKFIGTLEFARRNVILDRAPFDPSAFPHLHLPAEIMDREPGATVALMQPPQKGKSLLAQLHLARNCAVSPARTLMYSPTDKEMRSFSDEKLKPLLESVPEIQRNMPLAPNEQGGKVMFPFVDGPLSLLSANILAHRNSRSGQVIVMDESWQYDHGAIAEINRRSEAEAYKWCRRIIHTMTGPTEGTEAATLWESSSMHTWHVPCPHCNTMQVIERGAKSHQHGIRWDTTEDTIKDGVWIPREAAKTVRWVCPSCGESTTWTRAFQRSMMTEGKYLPTNPSPEPNIYGFRINSWVFEPWGDLVSEWLAAVNHRRFSFGEIEDFVRKKDVRIFKAQVSTASIIDYPEGSYAMLDAWEHEGEDRNKHPLRFMTVDVQQNHFWVLIRSWSNKEGHIGESRLRYFGKVLTTSEIEDIRKAHNVKPNMVWVDSAYNPTYVAQICAGKGYIMFDSTSAKDYAHADGVRRIYAEPRRYDAQQGGRRFSAPQVLFSALQAENQLDAIRSYRSLDGIPIWTIATDTPRSLERKDDYRSQAWARRKIRIEKKGGGFSYEFKNVADDEHAYDLEVAQIIMAAMAMCIPQEAKPPDEVREDKPSVDKEETQGNSNA